MEPQEKKILLTTYFKQGWLERRYFDGKHFCQPFSAEDRLRAGMYFYDDFLVWRKGTRLVSDYDLCRIDVTPNGHGPSFSFSAERFRQALKRLSKPTLGVIYQIVLNENEIKAGQGLSKRERLYFNDEIKGLLCRGLDELCWYYQKHII